MSHRLNMVLLTVCVGMLSGILLLVQPGVASATSLYGGLWKVLDADATSGKNSESVVMYYPDSPGFIAVTTNDTGAEWWVSGPLALNWKRTTANPLSSYLCTQAGRHSVVEFHQSTYFAANCSAGGQIFRLTGKQSLELVHTNTVSQPGYPTAAVLDDTLYMFFQGGYTSCDDTGTCTDVTTATNQPSGVPLEAAEEQDGTLALAFTSGEVALFDGSTYSIIGEEYLENLSSNDESNPNLPAITWYTGSLIVGNQDMKNGASLFAYNQTNSTWNSILDLGKNNTIVNKFQLSQKIDDTNYLIIYTANGNDGTNVIAMDPNYNTVNLVDPGLNSSSVTNNEVVSIITRTIRTNTSTYKVQLFGTQSTQDQTEVFILMLKDNLGYTPDQNDILSDAIEEESLSTSLSDELTTQVGETLTLRIPANQVRVGDKYILYVNGEQVDSQLSSDGKTLELEYPNAANFTVDDTFTMQLGRKASYGNWKKRIRSRNIIGGEELIVRVTE